MNTIFPNKQDEHRWNVIAEPDHEVTQRTFWRFRQGQGSSRRVLNCAVPVSRARELTQFAMPRDGSFDKSLITSGTGNFTPGLSDWRYIPKIKPEAQLPQLANLGSDQSKLIGSRWFQSPSQAAGMALNARHLRYHYELWQDIKPQVLRGLHTTLVYVTPQIGFALTPHIQLRKAFWYLSSLSRYCGPVQLFPAKYVYPVANLGGLADMPAPIFADILPATGGVSFPVIECTRDPWGVLARFDCNASYYGFPFSHATDPDTDVTLHDTEAGAMLLPTGERVTARKSEAYVYATLDERLREELKQDRDGFEGTRCLVRGTVTHDGLPFQLPVELQCMVYAIVLTHWEMTLDKPGDLTSYALRTRHAAVRGFNYYQRVEPYYTNFMRLIEELSRNPDFRTYPLATHLSYNWLGGNLVISNQRSQSEKEINADLMRHYYLQQLDWMAGVMNLWNHASFRTGEELEATLGKDGLFFHQMRRQLRFDSRYYQRPSARVSPWPDLHPGWLELDQTGQTNSLPRIS